MHARRAEPVAFAPLESPRLNGVQLTVYERSEDIGPNQSPESEDWGEPPSRR